MKKTHRAQNKIEVRVIKTSNKQKENIKEKNLNSEQNELNGFLPHEISLKKYLEIVDHSTILPQCIKAYKNNIAGFGIGVKYKEDFSEETKEMRIEFDNLTSIIDCLTLEKDTKELFEEIIDDMETYGIAYAEVIRDTEGKVIELCKIEDPSTITKTMPLDEYNINFIKNGIITTRPKKFRKYKQEVNGKTIYFKEVGDPRIMDMITGNYNDNTDISKIANEIIEFKVGHGQYGTPRWIGCTIAINGARRAENLNVNYFENGRHTPMMIMVKNGTLSEKSWDSLQEYMNGIRGEAGQHSFLVLEAEDLEGKTMLEDKSPVDVSIESLAEILQKDELFSGYIESSRRKVQSSFLLPDIYVAYTSDYNRATSFAAIEITEKQVFTSYRRSLAWIINNKLLSEYGFKYVEVYFKSPDLTNIDDLFKILTVSEKAGAITPNFLKDLTYKTIGRESEDFAQDWGNIPIPIQQILLQQEQQKSFNQKVEQTPSEQILMKSKQDDIFSLLKDVKKRLEKLDKQGKF